MGGGGQPGAGCLFCRYCNPNPHNSATMIQCMGCKAIFSHKAGSPENGRGNVRSPQKTLRNAARNYRRKNWRFNFVQRTVLPDESTKCSASGATVQGRTNLTKITIIQQPLKSIELADVVFGQSESLSQRYSSAFSDPNIEPRAQRTEPHHHARTQNRAGRI